MSVILGLIVLGFIVMLAMYLAQFVIMVVVMAIMFPIAGIGWIVEKVRNSSS